MVYIHINGNKLHVLGSKFLQNVKFYMYILAPSLIVVLTRLKFIILLITTYFSFFLFFYPSVASVLFLKNTNKTEATDGQKNRKKEKKVVINKIINFSRVNTTIREGSNAFKTYLFPSAGFFQVDVVSRKYVCQVPTTC